LKNDAPKVEAGSPDHVRQYDQKLRKYGQKLRKTRNWGFLGVRFQKNKRKTIKQAA
jgi:hypothetical protein